MQIDPTASIINQLILQNIQALTSSAFVAYAIETMKRSKYFPWINKTKTTLLRILSGIGSAMSAVGISAATEWSKGNHSLTIVISGLCFTCIVHSGYAWARSWIFTQMVYDGLIAKKSIGDPLPVAEVPAPAPAPVQAKGVAGAPVGKFV